MPLKPFIDSESDFDDTDLLRTRLAHDGYLFFRRRLDPSAVQALRAAIVDILDMKGWLAPGSDPALAQPGPLLRREGDENWWDGYVAVQSLYEFHRLMHDPSIPELVGRLLDTEAFVHPRSIARITYPNSEYPTPPHQDFPHIQGTSDVFTAWIPFGDVSGEMGGLRVLPGSHKSGLQATVAAHGPGGLGVEADIDDHNWTTIDYEMGDVLLFHSLTIHYAPPNRSDTLRISGDARYQAVSDPVSASSLQPHCYPNVPSWTEITAGWPDNEPIRTPAGLRMIDPIAPTEVRVDESRLSEWMRGTG